MCIQNTNTNGLKLMDEGMGVKCSHQLLLFLGKYLPWSLLHPISPITYKKKKHTEAARRTWQPTNREGISFLKGEKKVHHSPQLLTFYYFELNGFGLFLHHTHTHQNVFISPFILFYLYYMHVCVCMCVCGIDIPLPLPHENLILVPH